MPDKQRMLVAAWALCSGEMPEWTPGYFWVQKQLFQVPPAPGRCRVTALSCFTPNLDSPSPGGRTCREQGHFGHLLSPPAITFQGAKTLEEVLILSADPTGFQTRSKEPVGDPQTGNLPLPGKSRHWEAPVGVGGPGCVMNLLWFRAPGWNSPLSWHFPLSSAFPEAASVVKKGNEFCSERLLMSFKQILLQCFQLLALGRFAV